eukprot:212841_1
MVFQLLSEMTMATAENLRFDFLTQLMNMYKHSSPLISSSCGVSALKLSSTTKQSESLLSANSICESCGQILIFGKTKSIRFKTRTRNRNISISTLSKLIHKTKHKKKLNYSIQTCSFCNHKKYSKASFTSLKYLKKQRLYKLKAHRNKQQVLNLKNNHSESDKMKLRSKHVGLKTMNNIKQFAKHKSNHNHKSNTQQNEMDRLLGLSSSNRHTNSIKPKQKPVMPSKFNVTFKANKRRVKHKWKHK